jgi:hypothetical protein
MTTKRREMQKPMPAQLGSLRAMQRSHIDKRGNLRRAGHRTLLGIAAAICWLEALSKLTPSARHHLYGDLRRLLDELEAEDLDSAA